MIPAAESDAGLKAYEQVQAFAALRRRKLPWIYALFPVLLVFLGAVALTKGLRLAGSVCFVTALLFAVYSAWNWSRLRKLDAANRALLARLQAQYGDDLPWLEVERQMAQIRQIEAEEHLPPTEDPS
jgi:hypothetical protein